MEVIYEGTINGGVAVQVMPLTITHLDKILQLQELVLESLVKKEFLAPLTREEFTYIIEGNGLIVGAFAGEKLIAFRALLVPPMDDEHLGLDIGLAEAELPNVIYQEISNVHPDYRGNRLQQKLANLIMTKLAKTNHTYTYICATVAPLNIPSLKDKFSQGMEVAALKEKYGGKLRYIFVKRLDGADEQKGTETVSVKMSDITAQQSLLAEGWRGIRMVEQNGEYWVEYRR